VVKYASISVALIVLLVVLARHVLGLDVLSYTDPIGIAAILGLIGVIGLGVALMAATFYSPAAEWTRKQARRATSLMTTSRGINRNDVASRRRLNDPLPAKNSRQPSLPRIRP
jgi:hypothetical protein